MTGAVYGKPVHHDAGREPGTQHQQTEPLQYLEKRDLVPVQNQINRIAGAQKAIEAEAKTKGKNAEERSATAEENAAVWAYDMVWIGVAETIVTFFGVILVGWTLVHTRKAAEAASDAVKETRRIGEAQVRAYLSCIGATYDVSGDILSCWPSFKNTGQSPASNIFADGRVAIFLRGNVFVTDEMNTIVPAIAADSSDKSGLLFPITDEMKAILFEGLGFSVQGTVEWEDVFEKRDFMRFYLIPDGRGMITGEGDSLRRTGSMIASNTVPPKDGEEDIDSVFEGDPDEPEEASEPSV